MGDGLKRARDAARATRAQANPASDEAARYAAAVVKVLRDHTPYLTNAIDAEVVEKIVRRHVTNPDRPFECIVDDPRSARWRLKADSADRRRVRLAYCPVLQPGSDAERDRERTVNDALRALEADQ